MLGSVATRERLPLWAVVSFVAILGFAVSTLLAEAARDDALNGVVQHARDAGQVLTDTVSDKQLSDPIKGASYDKLVARISRSVPSNGSTLGVTVWSPRGRILFSLNKSLVGTVHPDMQPLLGEMSTVSGSYRVGERTVRAFVPVPRTSKDQVVLVQVDEPLAAVEAEVSGLWKMLRLAFAVGLTVSLLLLGLSFVSSLQRAVRRRDHEGVEDRGPREIEVVPWAEAEPEPEPEPAMEQAAMEQPAIEQPAAEQPAMEQPPVEQPAIKEPAMEHAATDVVASGRKPGSFAEALEALQAIQSELHHSIEKDAGAHDEAPEDAAARDAAPAQTEVRRDAVPTDEAKQAELAAEELMRKRREEFKARAAKAELRVKKLEADLQEAGSGPKSER